MITAGMDEISAGALVKEMHYTYETSSGVKNYIMLRKSPSHDSELSAFTSASSK